MLSADDLVILCTRWQQAPSTYGFAAVVLCGQQILKCDRDLAREFEVAESTVGRWASGTARPHPRLQAQIVRALKEKARDHAQKHQ